MELYRLASDFLFIECTNPIIVKKCISMKYKAITQPFIEALKQSSEGCTVLFVRTSITINNTIENDEEVILIDKEAVLITTALFEIKCRSDIARVLTGPKFIIMRYIDSANPVIEKLLTFMPQAEEITWDTSFNKGRSQNTAVIALTKTNLSNNISVEDLYNRMVLVRQPLVTVLRKLRQQGLCYISCSLLDNSWHELKIVIYDSGNETMKHYQRLINTLGSLEVAMILSENWTKDHPFVMVSIMAYQITILTLLPPWKMKKIILGLEYDKDGNRIVDLDLYHGKKKISWTDKNISHLGKNRDLIGALLHKELNKSLMKINNSQ